MKQRAVRAALIISGGMASLAAAQTASAPPKVELAIADSLDTITVTATRAPILVINAPASVSVITSADIDDNFHADIKDLVRFEPGVSVRSQPARFGAALGTTGRDGDSGFNIRGLEGNRVLIQTDGIRLPDGFTFGAQAVGRGDYADLDLLKSAEILRGPASALYGSDGLAGAVSFTTKDPVDFLSGSSNFGGRARIAWSSADEDWTKGAVLAGRSGDWSVLAAYTRRDSRDLDNKGTNDARDTSRTTPNPQDFKSDAVLAKLVWTPSDTHKLRLTYESLDRTVDATVLSAIARPPLAANSVLGLVAHDTTMRDRVSLDHRYKGGGLIESGQWAAYWQQSKTRQFTAEDRNTSADRTRDNSFDNRVFGVSGQIDLALGGTTIQHRVIVGGDASKTRQTGIRSGTIPPFGETFPTKAFPTTDYVLAGAFVQDRIDINDGDVTLYPALRLDTYSLDPRADPLFPGVPSNQSDTRLSPKFGAVGWLSGTFGVYASYAAGFKAPTPSQVNNGFTNVLQNYRSLANPDLKPESSDSIEGGLRLRNFGGRNLTASLTGYAGWYRDFIEQRQVSGSFTASDPAVFQFVNIGRVRISGIETKIEAELAPGLSTTVAAAYGSGHARSGAVTTPLSSVDPFKVVAAIAYHDHEGRFGGQASVTHANRKSQSRISEGCSPTCFAPPGFTIVDLTAHVRPVDWATLRIGVFNLFDEKYTWYSDARGLSAASTTLDAYTQPGRNISASLTVNF